MSPAAQSITPGIATMAARRAVLRNDLMRISIPSEAKPCAVYIQQAIIAGKDEEKIKIRSVFRLPGHKSDLPSRLHEGRSLTSRETVTGC
jgi:hypothetical protein